MVFSTQKSVLGLLLLLNLVLLGIILHFLRINLIKLSGDIETNPGPVVIPTKCIQGSFHQGNNRFGASAGSQCMCNAFWAISYAKIKSPRYWTY